MREAPSPSPLPFFVFPLLARVSFSLLFLSERSTDEPRIDLCNLSFWLGSEALTSPWPPGFGSLNHFWCARVPVYVLLVSLFARMFDLLVLMLWSIFVWLDWCSDEWWTILPIEIHQFHSCIKFQADFVFWEKSCVLARDGDFPEFELELGNNFFGIASQLSCDPLCKIWERLVQFHSSSGRFRGRLFQSVYYVLSLFVCSGSCSFFTVPVIWFCSVRSSSQLSWCIRPLERDYRIPHRSPPAGGQFSLELLSRKTSFST